MTWAPLHSIVAFLGNPFCVTRPGSKNEVVFPQADPHTCYAPFGWKTPCLVETGKFLVFFDPLGVSKALFGEIWAFLDDDTKGVGSVQRTTRIWVRTVGVVRSHDSQMTSMNLDRTARHDQVVGDLKVRGPSAVYFRRQTSWVPRPLVHHRHLPHYRRTLAFHQRPRLTCQGDGDYETCHSGNHIYRGYACPCVRPQNPSETIKLWKVSRVVQELKKFEW